MPAFPEPDAANRFLADHVRLLRTSLKALTGQELVAASLSDAQAAEAVFHAPFAVLSHDTASDPIFNYANKKALSLFEMTWDELTSLPSRLSAEAPNREERARLLAQVTQHGFISDYTGVRISRAGRRFQISQATVWNLHDEQGQPRGQAALIREWAFL
jgi:MEKHLA domain